MTRKHFEAIAAVLKSTKPQSDNYKAQQWTATVRAMADMCAAQNAQFKRDRFYTACGLES